MDYNIDFQKVLRCDKCGSTWFYETVLSRYAADAYSEMAGGDIRIIGTQQPIRMCVCGCAVSPNLSGGRVTRGASESRAAADAVDESRIKQDHRFESSVAALIERAATAQIWSQRDLIATLEARVEALEQRSPIAASLPGDCLKRQPEDRGSPVPVRKARRKQPGTDASAEFIDECCRREPEAYETASALYKTYCDWSRARRDDPMSETAFGSCLREKGFERMRRSGCRYRRGIRLKGGEPTHFGGEVRPATADTMTG